jgi:hypothetical protein
MTVEDTFVKPVGCQASEAERARLYPLRDALGLETIRDLRGTSIAET